MPNIMKELQPDRLREEIGQMITALTSPPYVEAMQAVRAAPVSQRLVEGSKRLTPEALRAQGVPLPSNMRISSRYFEEGLPGPINFGEPREGEVNLVNALNKAQPGLLDRLRTDKPDVFRRLVESDPEVSLESSLGMTANRSSSPMAMVGGCCCGGGATVCAGCGGDSKDDEIQPQ